MTKMLDDSVLDASLAEFATSVRQCVCSSAPANFAGIASVALTEQTLTPGDGNGDFTIGNASGGGREVTVAAQNGVDIDADGEATHVSYDDGEVLLGVTELDESEVLSEGGTVNIAAHKVTLADPV